MNVSYIIVVFVDVDDYVVVVDGGLLLGAGLVFLVNHLNLF